MHEFLQVNFLHAVDYRIKLPLKFQDCNTALKTHNLLHVLGVTRNFS